MPGEHGLSASSYRGRFAPSPTGPLHLGSLLTAVASYADARARAGTWLVRIEDLDRPREVPGAADQILRTLDAFGLHWDEAVVYQSRRAQAYREALERLTAGCLTYPCGCTRAEIARDGRPGLEGRVYPGTCRGGLRIDREAQAIRFRVPEGPIGFEDRVQGPQTQSVAESVGDFVVRRADGIPAYQLAVVVDDAWQGITHVVRGADLLLSTPRQVLLQTGLGLRRPRYAHVPLVVDPQGRKLSKSLGAVPIETRDPLRALRLAWGLLGQPPPPADLRPGEFWAWAARAWTISCVPAAAAIRSDGSPPAGDRGRDLAGLAMAR